MTHNLICRAHAIGCAVENIADATWSDDKETRSAAHRLSPIAEGDRYLTNGSATCFCDCKPAEMVWAAPWILLGLDALSSSPEPTKG